MDLLQGLWILFFAVAGIQLAWWCFFTVQWWRIRRQRPVPFDETPVSLLIAARNEGQNLLDHLPEWLSQLRKGDELIVANDRSTDDTALVLQAFSERHEQLHVVTIKEAPSRDITYGKKFALTLAIKAAANDRLAFTDADCLPHNKDWRDTMSGSLKEAELVLGCGFVAPGNSFVSRLAHADSLHTAIMYQSFAKANAPYMGVGRSMAYQRDLFVRHRGFYSHRKLQSGDDDLFVSSLSNVRVVSRPEALTWTQAPGSLKAYVEQRTRHASTSFRYSLLHKLLLGVYYTSLALFWPMFAVVLFAGNPWIATGLAIIRINLLLISLYLMADSVNSKPRIWLLWLGDVILSLCYPVFTIGALWRRKHKWKS